MAGAMAADGGRSDFYIPFTSQISELPYTRVVIKTMNRHGHRRVDWMGSLFVGMLMVYLISWSFLLYYPGGMRRPDSWRQVYFYFVGSTEMACAWGASSLSMIGFAIWFLATGRRDLGRMALITIGLGIIALFRLPAYN
jgi:hypothetical protein